MSNTLIGRIAMVTGASKGIGRAIALALAEEGATVVATARDSGALQHLAADAENMALHVVAADATNQTSVDAAVDAAIHAHGKLDILVNNVGGAGIFGGFADLTDADWHHAFDLNVLSMVHFVKAAEPHLRRSKHARIINISSIAGVQPGTFNPHYTVTKAATINLSKFLSNYFVKAGVLVNVICPGPVHSDSWDNNVQRMAKELGMDFQSAWQKVELEESIKIPLGRVGEGSDIAGLVAFLASDKASWITGSCFHVNGGKLATM